MTAEHWKEIEKLYLDCLRLPPDERGQFLVESCANEGMRLEVQSLLVQREDLPSLLEERGLDVVANMMPRNEPGTLVGCVIDHYEVRSFIGAGGMGAVYRAHDRKLDRDVALKVLPAQFLEDPDWMRRSEREAKLLASLNHPNIAAIYDLQVSDDVRCLVLELVQGETLAEKLKRGPVPLVEALEISRQIAEAVEAAHEQGIVHRDLKPANVMSSADGRVKVLDFGIAKMLEPAGQSGAPTHIESASAALVLGTPSYMSPEQARGKPLDKRTDIWAFGCVLYELLTRTRAFQGETVTDTLAAVVERDPDWQAIPTNVPAKIQDLLRRCLQKDVRQRLRDIGDARLQIEETVREPASGPLRAPAGKRSLSPGALPIIAASLVLGSLFAWIMARTHTVAPAVIHLTMGIQPADQLGTSTTSWSRPSRTLIAFSPDGQTIVFSAMRENASQLFSRKLDQSQATPIPGTKGGIGPFFSPDGRWVAFWTDGKIKKVPIDGGPTLTICDTPASGGQFVGATWAANDTIFFSSPATAPRIFKAPAAGGKAEEAATPNVAAGEQFMLPHALPGGKALLLTARKSFASDTARVVVHSLETGENRLLIEDAADARYVPTGHLVYMKSGTLMAVPFDLGKLRVTGDSVALVENVMQAAGGIRGSDFETTAGQFAISASGALVYLTGGTDPPLQTSVVLLNRKGEVQEGRLPAPLPSASLRAPRLSPDQGKVAVPRGTPGHYDVWVYDLLGTGFHRVTFTDTNPYAAVWSPDGKRLVYSSFVPGHSNLFVVNAEGNSPPETVTNDIQFEQFASSWTPVGNRVAYMQEHLPATSEIWTIGMDDGKRELFLKNPAPGIRLQYPEFSPDGHWMAYVSNESGGNEVYVRAYPSGGEAHKISAGRGNSPIWTSGDRELLYRAPTANGAGFFSATITSLSPFQSAPPQKLFEAPRNRYTNLIGIRSWDATPDGQRLLLERFEESKDKPVTEFQIILNWTEELKRRVRAR